MGALQSLDFEDVDREGRSLTLVHRPDEGTTLKNGTDGERIVVLPNDVTETIADYIDYKRTS